MRGGAWNNNPQNVRVSNRNRNEPTNRNNNIGFRCVGYAERGLGGCEARGREPVSSTEIPGVPTPFSGPLVPTLASAASNSKRTRVFW